MPANTNATGGSKEEGVRKPIGLRAYKSPWPGRKGGLTRRNMMSPVQTNMRVLNPSRIKNRAGSVFTLQMPDGLFSFGRLVSTDVNAGMGPGAQLIYVFSYRSQSKELPLRTELRSKKLLLPPLMTNRLPWTRGYFETIAATNIQGHRKKRPGTVFQLSQTNLPSGL
ncbi:Imm26 family immunity protein [Paenarthrobacter sp. NyZ202]|uniref:Imm26 family immunity protein n=1 Tax=Paenarthrobacter sp. NyZ202 TaxID=3402689 RepID=UPI003CE8D225